MISAELVDRLRFESESDALDFKSSQYLFSGATDEDKAELLKDILAFANSWRRSDAFILIGVREAKSGPAEIVGISDHLNDAHLQQFVNGKTQRPLRFAYAETQVGGKDVGVIHIPIQQRPFYLTKRYGGLNANAVYVRRGSSTAVSLPDEVAQMGRPVAIGPDIGLDVFFANPRTRERVAPRLRSHVLSVPPKRSIAEYKTSRGTVGMSFRHVNRDYYRELVNYTAISRLVSPIWLAVRNDGASTAVDVRLEMILPGAREGITVLDEYEYPKVPQAEHELYNLTVPAPVARISYGLGVEDVAGRWIVSARMDKVQPKSTEWLYDAIYIGAIETRAIDCKVKVFADELSAPHEQTLSLHVEAVTEDADLDRVFELEDERLRKSPEFRAFLEEHDNEVPE